jgi:RNA recognition motif. (a.k.a. RRM, RBD, or RNP domain)
MTDPISGMSRGYGFVRFSSEEDQQLALSQMQGVYCGNRPMRISTATPKNKGGPGGPGGPGGMGMQQGGGPMGYPPAMGGGPPMGFYNQQQPMNQFTDPNNTTVFVGGLSGYVTEDELRSFFQGFGEITYVKIPPGKGCGFVQFVQRHAAEMAINQMQGYPIGNSRVRLSWGRSQNNSGPAGTPYRPAPPPPIYPSMGMPPSHQYGNFAPMKVPDAFFLHHINPMLTNTSKRMLVLSKHKLEFLSDNFFLLACFGACSGMSKSSQWVGTVQKSLPAISFLSAVQRSILSELRELCARSFFHWAKIHESHEQEKGMIISGGCCMSHLPFSSSYVGLYNWTRIIESRQCNDHNQSFILPMLLLWNDLMYDPRVRRDRNSSYTTTLYPHQQANNPAELQSSCLNDNTLI